MENIKTEKELEAIGYTYHHSAAARGYTRVANRGICRDYKGRFGEGFVRYCGPHNNSTQYERIQYWIKA